jgi:hypothetical protein
MENHGWSFARAKYTLAKLNSIWTDPKTSGFVVCDHPNFLVTGVQNSGQQKMDLTAQNECRNCGI